VTLPASLLTFPADPAAISATAWGCLVYVALMSQFIGFFFWNQGLALGGVAKVGQVQLLQTFITLAAALFINGEALTPLTLTFAFFVAACVWFARTAKVG
jgi:drug/metabolite transporter (DMT)-like permease